MNWQDVKIECIQERDIDLLLLEEWSVNPDFAYWILEQCGINERFVSFNGYHSVTDPQFGETDLLLIAENDSEKIAILLENKIDAIAQPKQAERYFLRAEKLRQELNLSQTIIGIVAPDNYLQNNQEAANYPFQISYESTAEYLDSLSDIRSKYRAAVVFSAIEKERRGYRPVKDEQVSRFWHDYWTYLRDNLPDVYMKEPDIVPSNSDWPGLKFDWFPSKWKLVHKLSRGVLDLETKLTESDVSILQKNLENTDFSIIKTGKSYSVRLNVVPLDRNQPLEEQLAALQSCIDGIKKFAHNICEI